MIEQVFERISLIQIVLKMLIEAVSEHITQLLDVNAGRGHHFREILIDQSLRSALNLDLEL